MNTLRAKLAVLLTVVIISVVCILTGILIYLFDPPNERQAIGPLVEQIELLTQANRIAPKLVVVQQAAASGKVESNLTSWLRDALTTRGTPRDVIVSRKDDLPLLSIPLDQGWIVTQITDLPPGGGVFHLLLIWLAVTTLGTMAVALFFANRMVKPLVLLERAIETVGPDAVLPELAMTGPAEVRVAARALNSLSSRLKGAMESRMRLVAAAGHDLRTPITRMRLRAEFVENDEDREMWLKDIDELDRIADSAILLVREESGKSAPEPIRLDILISDLVDELRTLSYDITLTRAAAGTAQANRTGLSRAFRNLIINAATHGKKARVAVQSTATEIIVVIDDDGPGIPPGLIGQVFEPFFRVDRARMKQFDGAGLGLTIAREIIQRAGGSIKIENGSLRGLIQTVTLPATQLLPAEPH
ncbi:signal transduction histidine kinase [Bradyrhizobium sp. CIR18]|uniref:sensor histidine kinase n=1 Tax=Bradyrhizobium sp. CIR18 TaxID=2663839 RepID=UPI00185022DA|nr:ATP-binding protein [Bradyrhizobium sp. CIR18]MBB4362513.1 signal transduction histidine kinase [Bradyrhizobium sp. CIR18]